MRLAGRATRSLRISTQLRFSKAKGTAAISDLSWTDESKQEHKEFRKLENEEGLGLHILTEIDKCIWKCIRIKTQNGLWYHPQPPCPLCGKGLQCILEMKQVGTISYRFVGFHKCFRALQMYPR